MKENLSLLKDLLGSWKTRFLSMWQLFQKCFFDELEDIVNKYNNTVHRTTKVKPTDITSDSYAEYNEDSNETKPKFKVGDRVKILKSKKKQKKKKTVLLKDIPKICQKKFLLLVKLKTQFLGHTWLVTWMVKNCRKLVRKNSE